MRLTAWITVEEHISPLPVKQVGESIFVNTSTTPPVTCSEAELWENGQCGKNSHIASRDSIIPLQSWFFLQRRLRIFKLTVTGTSSICCGPDTLGQAFQPWQAHSALENRETRSFLSHVSSEQNKKDPESHGLLAITLKIFELCCAWKKGQPALVRYHHSQNNY